MNILRNTIKIALSLCLVFITTLSFGYKYVNATSNVSTLRGLEEKYTVSRDLAIYDNGGTYLGYITCKLTIQYNSVGNTFRLIAVDYNDVMITSPTGYVSKCTSTPSVGSYITGDFVKVNFEIVVSAIGMVKINRSIDIQI